MSKVELNALVNGFSGKIGNAVLRKRGGNTYLSQKAKPRTSAPTEKEKAHRVRFRKAAAFAKAKMSDPVEKAAYEQMAKSKDQMSAFTAAISDYLKAPQLEAIDADKYNGSVNDVITIIGDGKKLISVTVVITAPNGALIESGAAVFDETVVEWKYKATTVNPNKVGTTVKATATDRPGNQVSLEKVIA